MTTLSYQEWIKQNPQELEEIKCSRCDGTGEEECPHCGSITECEKCHGEGTIKDARKKYDALCKRDMEKLKKWARVTP